MRVIINRNLCGHPPFACEQCFGEFLRTGAYPDRSCIMDVVEDAKPEVTAVITSGVHTRELVITDDIREEVIYDGYMKFADFPDDAYEIQMPDGNQIRKIIREYQEQHPQAEQGK